MTTSLGFRPPRFSEDVAWLPGWLQQCQANPNEEFTKESSTTPNEMFEDLALLGNIDERKNTSLLVKGQGQYDNCNLFLSGEDNAAFSIGSSPGNVLHLQLHLSSASNTASPSSPLLETPQEVMPDTDNILAMQQVQSSSEIRDMRNLWKKSCKTDARNSFSLPSNPKLSETIGLQSFNSNKNTMRKHQEKFNVGCHKDVEIDHSVELSVSASEALVIHDLVKNDSSSDTLSASAVLEVALKVKEARLMWVEDASHSHTDEVNEDFDFLSDLEESAMEEAFEDAGLSVIFPNYQEANDSIISQVKETPNTGKFLEFDDEFQHLESGSQEIAYVDTPIQEHLTNDLDMDTQLVRALPSEIPDFGKEIKPMDKSLSSNTAADCPGPQQHQQIQSYSYGLSIEQGVGFVTKDSTSSQPWEIVKARSLKVREEINPHYLDPERFSSHWFGGWTGKEVDNSDQVKLNNAKGIPNVYAGETSFLSESADIAPDENSIVHKHETTSMRASQSSVALNCRLDKVSEEAELSQEIVRSSGSSSVDPLCSVVPCSIPSETTGPMQQSSSCQNGTEVDADNSFSTPIFVKNLFRRTTDPIDKLVDEDGQGVRTIGGNPVVTVRRNLTSLKNYSMLSPGCNIFKMENFRCSAKERDSGVNPPKQNNGSVKSSVKRNSEGAQPSTSNCNTGSDSENYHGSFVTGDLNTEITCELRNGVQNTNGELEFRVNLQGCTSCPKVLNIRGRHCLLGDKHLLNESSTEVHPKSTASYEGLVKFQHQKELQVPHIYLQADTQIVTESNTGVNAESAAAQGLVKSPHQRELQVVQLGLKNSCDIQIPRRKQVRFVEADLKNSCDIEIPMRKQVYFLEANRKKQIQKTQQLDKFHKGSNSKIFKKLKTSNFLPETGSQEVKRRSTNCHIKRGDKMVFQGIEFLLTGFSTQKEKQIEGLIRKYGGIVLFDIPSPKSRGKRSSKFIRQKLPVILCTKKLETTKFLYGCAISACILKVNWLMDCIAAGSVLAPDKYMILSSEADGNFTNIRVPVCHCRHKFIFERVGIMLHGEHSFTNKLSKIFKHGGGFVYKTLQWLVQSLDSGKLSLGAIVVEDSSTASRHLKHCASERNIPMVSSSWIISSLHQRKLLPFTESDHSSLLPGRDGTPVLPILMDLSEEI